MSSRLGFVADPAGGKKGSQIRSLLQIAIWLSAAMLAAISGKAAAQSVVLLRPAESDAELVDVSNRVEAELHLHGFHSIAREGSLGPNLGVALRNLARSASALAAIGFTRAAGEASLHVWLIDRRSGGESLRSLTLAPRTSDAPSLVAVRAVDLLRAAILEVPEPQAPEPEPDPEPVQPGETAGEFSPPSAADSDLPLRVPNPWSFELAGTLQWPGREFGLAYGPALGLFHRPLPYLQWGVWFLAPVISSPVTTQSGSADVYRELAFAELRLPLLQVGYFSAGPLVGVGVAFLQGDGDPMQPLTPARDSIFGALGVVGLHLEQSFGSGFGLGLSLRALAHAPLLGVAVRGQERPLQQPVLEAALGIAVEL